ncbi:carbohydrate porin [Kiritimatiellota bacterium B12222]|nr:carbohydrate porin [Kiritimatiellota bacterium B12222]
MKKLLTLLLCAGISVAVAQEESDDSGGPWTERDQLTGDWGGSRTKLEDSGVTPFLYYDGIAGAAVSGGLSTGNAYTGQVYAGIDLDFDKMLGWEGTIMKISMVNRHGDSVSSDVGGIFDPMTIYGGADGQTTILYQIWIEKRFNDQWALKFGRDSQDSDFANDDLYRYSLSTAINGPIRAMMLDRIQIVSFPLGVWSARLKYNINEEHQLQFGAYQVNDHIWDMIPGTDFDIDDDDGVTYMLQYDWTPQINDRPARLFVGLAESFYNTTTFDGEGADNIYRVYGHFDFEVIENLTLFTFGAYTDQDDLAQMPLQISAGANWKGLIPGREDDRTIAFFTYGGLSDEWGASMGENVDAEIVYELGHRFQVIPAFYIQPSVQYIQDPGGTGDIPDAVVLGAWIGASF